MKKIGLYAAIITILISSCGKREKMYAYRKNIIDAVFASGNIQYSDEYWVTANAEGFIMETYVKESDQVDLNQSLFQLSNDVQSLQSKNAFANYQNALINNSSNSPQIAQLKNQIAQLRASHELDKKNYERYSELVKTNAISQLDFEKAELQYNSSQITLSNLEKSLIDLKNNLQLSLDNAKNKLDIQKQYYADYHIKSMISGYVLEVNKNKGELVKKGDVIARIGGGSLITKLYVAEEDINKVKLGQKVQLALNTEKDKTYQAKVSKIYPSFDNDEQSFVIEVKFINKAPQLYSGTQVQANIIIDEQKNALVIPKKYLIKNNKVLGANNEEIQVKIGIINAEWVQIVEGIDETFELVLPNK